MEKYKETFRIPSARLQDWNYNCQAGYFITICTHNRVHYFGEINDGKMSYTPIGITAKQEWLHTPLLRPDMHLLLDSFVVMPNHFHGILIIGENDFNNRIPDRDARHGVSTRNASVNAFGPQRKNLSSIVRGFKSSITIFARKHNFEFEWQERFHDHIIRNDEEYTRIRDYIQQNVLIWDNDQFY